MDYAELPLPPALDGLVAAVWTLAADQPGWVEHEATPDGCIELIRRSAGRSEWRRDQPEYFATGLSNHPIRFGFSGDARFTAIKLWPWAWHALGGTPCPRFADTWIAVDGKSPLAALLHGDPVANLVRALAGTTPPPLARAILTSAGVGEIAARAGLPHRRLQRIFARELGLAPRAYLRLLRFRAAMQDVQQGGDSLADTAAARGYADQAHMARDFRALAGVPPSNARDRARGPFL
ncbi:helix-turn-helix domain-containing protein [Sphingomonas sp. HITSZ_GF]|uniref:helix-turn-helix domain-containing protein n=1 Tax=Sphingomonas sp. HITSZ_GF TaxID=3037247 RepID=UPI00240D290A|nr:helix-turn-helix domain-containing protein [Sphingomonas sp. HITSZ_GF]MDG2534757.1 helix-turn-helix domain-containing protein [Sphingomonas sp. HITSZ_GF]